MTDEQIAQFLDGELGSSFGVRMPKQLLDRIVAAYKKVTRGTARGDAKGPAVAYFAARGLLDWEEALLSPGATTEFEQTTEGNRPGRGRGKGKA